MGGWRVGRDPRRPGGGRGAQGRPRGGASRQGWGRGGPAASLLRSWRRGGWPRRRTEPREGGRREEGGSRPAAMGPGARGRRRHRLMSPLPPLPSVRALPLLLLLAVPGSAGEGLGPRGLDVRGGGGGGEEEQQSARTPESAGWGSPGTRGQSRVRGAEPGAACQSRGAGTQNGMQGPRGQRHWSPTDRAGDEGAQESGTRSSRCEDLRLKIGAGGTKNLGLAPNPRSSGILGRSRLEPKYPQGGDPSYKAPRSPTRAGLTGRGAGRGREVLGALNSEETSQAGTLQDPEPECE